MGNEILIQLHSNFDNCEDFILTLYPCHLESWYMPMERDNLDLTLADREDMRIRGKELANWEV